MKLKHGTVRLDAAAEWLSKTTGRTFTADDLIDAHDKLPICALIPQSLANPRYSGPVQRAFRAKLIEVERATDVAALGGTLTDDEIAEKAVKLLPEGVRLRFEWEKEAKAEGVYSMTAKDVRLLVRHGVQRLSRAVPASDNIFEEGFPSWIRSRGFHPWFQEDIKFGTPVDITADMLCVLRSHLQRYAEQVAAQQVEAPAQMHDPARGQEAEPKADDEQTHQGQAAEMTPRKRAAIIKSLGRRYPALESALNRGEAWAKECRVPKESSPDGKQGWYYLERIEDQCRARYGATAPAPVVDLSPAGQLHRIGK